MIGPAESERSDASEQELNPGRHRQCFAHYAVSQDHHPSNLAMYAPLEMKLEVDAHDDLRDEHDHDDGDEFGVDVVFGELPALVFMTQEVADDGEDGTGDLYWNVPFRTNYLDLSECPILCASHEADLTPKTIPKGKMIPHANPCTKMCSHSIESMGSAETAWPSSILLTWCSCAVAAALNKSAAVSAACLVLRPMLTSNRAAVRQMLQLTILFDGSGVEALDGNRHTSASLRNCRSVWRRRLN